MAVFSSFNRLLTSARKHRRRPELGSGVEASGPDPVSEWAWARCAASLPRRSFPLSSSARLPKIEADSGLIRAVEGEGVEQSPRRGVMLTTRRL
jgi:hypothetical protein